MSVAVGIDLGTTNSCVAICQEGQVQIIPNREQERITPSFVFYSDEGTIVGRKAKSLALLKWSNAVYDFKRIIGKKFSDDSIQKLKKSWSFTLAEGENHECRIEVVQKGVKLKLRAEEVSAEVLRKLKEDAEFFLQKPVSDAVITVPAYFNNLQRRATEDAAKIAGLKVLKLINEPTAAALAFGQNSKVRENKSVLVYDLGGGTFDVSIVNFEGDSGRIIVAKGDNNLGGIDFDRNLLIHVLSQIEEKYHIALEKFAYDKRRRLMSRILSLCEHAKKELSQKLATAMILDHFEGQDVRIEIAREKFEDLNLKLFQETIEIVAEAVQKSNLEKIDHILLVGGSTKIPKVRELIRDCFGVEPNKSVNPLEAVAAGAAIQAAGIINSSQISLTDVIPLSLGVEVVANETMNVLIKSSEKIPASVSKKYYTIYDYQTDAIIKVYEGSAKNVEENVFLDEVCIRDITPKPAGEVAFTVTFAVDLNGILTVTATEDSKNMRKDLTILLSNSNRMTVEEIAKSIERMKCNKAEDD